MYSFIFNMVKACLSKGANNREMQDQINRVSEQTQELQRENDQSETVRKQLWRTLQAAQHDLKMMQHQIKTENQLMLLKVEKALATLRSEAPPRQFHVPWVAIALIGLLKL